MHSMAVFFFCEMSIEFRRTRSNKVFLSALLTQFPSILNIEISQGTVRKLKPLQPQNKKSKISPASQEQSPHQPGTLLKSPLTNLLV